VLAQRGVAFMLSGSWTAKERKRTKITKTKAKVRQGVPEPDTGSTVAYARGELVSRSGPDGRCARLAEPRRNSGYSAQRLAVGNFMVHQLIDALLETVMSGRRVQVAGTD